MVSAERISSLRIQANPCTIFIDKSAIEILISLFPLVRVRKVSQKINTRMRQNVWLVEAIAIGNARIRAFRFSVFVKSTAVRLVHGRAFGPNEGLINSMRLT